MSQPVFGAFDILIALLALPLGEKFIRLRQVEHHKVMVLALFYQIFHMLLEFIVLLKYLIFNTFYFADGIVELISKFTRHILHIIHVRRYFLIFSQNKLAVVGPHNLVEVAYFLICKLFALLQFLIENFASLVVDLLSHRSLDLIQLLMSVLDGSLPSRFSVTRIEVNKICVQVGLLLPVVHDKFN